MDDRRGVARRRRGKEAAITAAPVPPFGLLQQYGRLASLLKYSLVFSALIVLLPLSGIEGVPLEGITGNLFVELSPWGVFWASLFLGAAAWSVMLTTGLVVNAVIARWNPAAASYRTHALVVAAPSGLIPAWAETLFSVPITSPQLLFFASLAGPGLAVIIRYAVRHGPGGAFADHAVILSCLAAAAGIVVAYIVMLVLCAPAALLDPGDPPLRDPIATRVWRRLSQATWLTTWVCRARRWLSRWAAWLRLAYLLDRTTGLLYPPHFMAITNFVVLALFWLLFAYLFRPDDGGLIVAPVVHLWVSLLLFIWVFGLLEFHLGRLRISPLVVLAGVFLVGYAWLNVDHTYTVNRRRASGTLDPVAVAEAGRGPNLVVIASAGGGISAAVWTTLGLERLIVARPDLLHEIRLLSTISGGSVGAAYFVDGILRTPPTAAPPGLGPLLETIRAKSGTSSLGSIAYGFAFRDFPSLLSGGLVSIGLDRGQLLEGDWARIAGGSRAGVQVTRGSARPLTLDALRQTIRAGEVPGFIFGTTVMESGRRVMITPIDFPFASAAPAGPAAPGSPAATALTARPGSRAATLLEYLGRRDLDVDLWTAARLSATFAFVSPAARSTLADQQASRKGAGLGLRPLWHHLIDGGYYDNFGVTSALDWLTPVLVAKAEGTRPLAFTRVAIVQLRAWHRFDPAYSRPASGAAAALLGPVLGLGAIRDGAAAERDDIDVGRFVTVWNRWFANQPRRGREPRVCLEGFVLEPDGNQPSPPLSWQLSSSQLKRLIAAWPAPAAARFKDFLEKGSC